MTEAVCTSETLVYSETTQHYIPEASHLHTCHYENLKSQITTCCFSQETRRSQRKTISNTEETEEQEGYSSSEVGDDCHPNTPTYEGRKRG
jgi:hypothetical protein